MEFPEELYLFHIHQNGRATKGFENYQLLTVLSAECWGSVTEDLALTASQVK